MILLDPKSGQMPAPAGAKHLLSSCNRADVIGNVTRDPEMRTTTSGQKVVTIGVATNERWKDKASGEMKERSEFHNVVVWGDLAQEVSNFIRKGSKVFVSGRVQTRSWETQDGKKRYTTEVIAESLSMLGVKNPVADESIQAGAAGASVMQASPDAQFDQTPQNASGPAFAAVPDLNYGSEIKVEDLPF
jgi:single-strand DNA-binding protein